MGASLRSATDSGIYPTPLEVNSLFGFRVGDIVRHKGSLLVARIEHFAENPRMGMHGVLTESDDVHGLKAGTSVFWYMENCEPAEDILDLHWMKSGAWDLGRLA